MADLRRSGERAQLMLVAAIGLAVLFVALAVVLNTVIYTENLATRGGDVGAGSEPSGYVSAVRAGVLESFEYANYHNNSTQSGLRGAFEDQVLLLGNLSGYHYASSGRDTNLSVEAITDGSRITQAASGDFTSADGTDDWQLASGVSETRSFRVNVTRSALKDVGTPGQFEVIVDDGASTWRLNVTKDGANDVLVGIDQGGADVGTCTASGPSVWINLTAGTVAGDPCQPLDFGEGVGTTYEIRYENGSNVTGTYTLVVDTDTVANNVGGNPDLNDPGSGSPFATFAVFDTEVRIVYTAPRVRYNTTVGVMPGESDA